MYAANQRAPWKKSITPEHFMNAFKPKKREEDDQESDPKRFRKYSGTPREQRLQWEAELDRQAAASKELNGHG